VLEQDRREPGRDVDLDQHVRELGLANGAAEGFPGRRDVGIVRRRLAAGQAELTALEGDWVWV
jgi:hypothetical protein